MFAQENHNYPKLTDPYIFITHICAYYMCGVHTSCVTCAIQMESLENVSLNAWYSGHMILGGISDKALDINEIKTTTTLNQ